MIKIFTIFFVAVAMYALATGVPGGAILFLICALVSNWGDRAFAAREQEKKVNPKHARTPPGTMQLLDEHACESSSSFWDFGFQFGKSKSDSDS